MFCQLSALKSQPFEVQLQQVKVHFILNKRRNTLMISINIRRACTLLEWATNGYN